MRLCNRCLKSALILSALCGSVALTACGGVQNGHNDFTGEPELSVWLDGYSGDYMNALLDQFVRENPGVTIKSSDFTDVNIPDFRTKLANDLMAGEGPDIVLASNTANNTIQNLTKLLQNDIFLDTAELSVDLSGCDQRVLAAGRYDGKQYMIPLNYSVGFMVTSEERLSKYGVDDSDLGSFADSLEVIYKDGRYAFLDVFTTEFLYRQNGIELIDYENKSLRTDKTATDLLRGISDAYEKLFPGIFSENKYNDYRFTAKLKDYGGSVDQAYGSGDLVFYSAPAFMGYYENISYMNTACARILSAGDTPALITFPTVDGSAPSPNVNYLVLVNANTENKEAAKLFIESAVGIESQYLCGMSWGIPVNTGLVGKLRDFYVDGKVDEKYTFNDDCVLPEGFAKKYFDAIDSLDDGVYIDVMTSGRLFSVVREYCSNGGDISAALESGKKNVSLYLSE